LNDLRFAIFGTGFWARFQLSAWREVTGVQCAALYNRTRSKAETLAQEFGVPAVYDTPEQLLDTEQLDFIDIITDVETHAPLVKLATAHKLPVICQKPMAPSLEIAQSMVDACHAAGVPLFIHENWRWQTPIREVQRVLATGVIGQPFRARIDMISGFEVFANQPFLKTLDQFILTDLGSHILDVARSLFGEAESLICQTQWVHADIRARSGVRLCTLGFARMDRREVWSATRPTDHVDHAGNIADWRPDGSDRAPAQRDGRRIRDRQRSGVS